MVRNTKEETTQLNKIIRPDSLSKEDNYIITSRIKGATACVEARR